MHSLTTKLLNTDFINTSKETYIELLTTVDEDNIFSIEEMKESYMDLAVKSGYATIVNDKLSFTTTKSEREYKAKLTLTNRRNHIISVLYYLSNPKELHSMLNMIVENELAKEVPTAGYSLINSRKSGDVLEFLINNKIVTKKTVGIKKITYFTLHKDLVTTPNDKIEVVYSYLDSIARPRTSTIKAKDLKRIKKYGAKSLDKRDRTILSADNKDALLKLSNQPLQLSEDLFTPSAIGITPVASVARELASTYRTTEDDLQRVYVKYFATLLKELRFETFYQDYGVDYSGRMYPTKALSINNKCIRRFTETGLDYSFNTKSKVASVSRLYDLLVDNDKRLSRKSLGQVEVEYNKVLARVLAKKDTFWNKLSNDADIYYPAMRLLNSLRQDHTKVNHLVGMDVTNQGSQNISIMTGDSKLFNYCGSDLNNTAYKAVADAFIGQIANRVTTTVDLTSIINAKSMKYRFMTVPYNQAPVSQVLGSIHELYNHYVNFCKDNEIKEIVDIREEWAETDEATESIKALLTDKVVEYVDENDVKVLKYKVASKDLPLKYMLIRHGVLTNNSISDDELVEMFIKSVNEVSPVLFKFSTTYKKSMYTKDTAKLNTLNYKSMDGYSVQISKKELRTEVIRYSGISSSHSITKHIAYNSGLLNTSKLSGSPLYLQSVDSSQARYMVLNANAYATMHDEYFIRLCDVEQAIEVYDEMVIELFNSNHVNTHIVEAGGTIAKSINTLGDCLLTEEMIRESKFKFWF